MSDGRGGKARGRPTCVECDTAHHVVRSGARLMARPAGGVSATVVPDLHLEAVGPIVPCFVPGWFAGRPMGWAAGGGSADRLAGVCEGWHDRCQRSGGHHHGDCALDVLDVPGEGGVRRYEVVDGGILLDGCVGEVVKRRGHLLCLLDLHGLVGAENGVVGCHAGDVTHFGKRCRPVEFPLCPCVLNFWAALPLSPVERHVAVGNCVLGSGGDHELVGDRDTCVGGKDLALLLFLRVDSQWEVGLDADVELGHVVVQVGLADLSVRGQDVLDQRAEVDAIESFRWIAEGGVVYVDGGGKLVSSDGEDKVVGSPCFACGEVDGV
jgi:hypothetical protein